MRRLSYIIALTTVVLSGFCKAETLSVKASEKYTQSTQCNLMTGCEGSRNIIISANHAFTISPLQESQLTNGTSVTVTLWFHPIQINLSDDPNFSTGDKSATITTHASISGVPSALTVKLAWNKGQMRVAVKGSGSVNLSAGSSFTVSDGGPQRIPIPVYLVATKIENNAGMILQEFGIFGHDVKTSERETALPNGDEKRELQYTLKSKFMTVEPID